MSQDKIPKSWMSIELGEVCELYQPQTISTKQLLLDGKYYVYGANGIIGKYDKYNHENEELLITCRGATCGNVHITKPFSWINGNAMVVRPISNLLIDLRYLFFVFSFGKRTSPAITGTAQPQITRTSLSPIEIPLPPLAEQHRIVARIEELFSSLDKGIESLKTAREQLKVYRQAVLKWAFEGRLTNPSLKEGELPEGWEEKCFGEIFSISSGVGLTKNNRNDNGSYNVFGGNGISGKHEKYLFEDQRLIIGRVGVHCGNVHITTPMSWITDNAFIVDFDTSKYNIHFLLHLIRFHNFNKLSSSTAQPVISQGKIYPVKAIFPRQLTEQLALLQEIESRLSVCDKIEESIEQSLQQAEALRQSILKKAFEGKLVPQDPSDEPASVLLERIRAQRQTQVNKKTPKTTKKSLS
jgi:type I restriction enzyme S subunit